MRKTGTRTAAPAPRETGGADKEIRRAFVKIAGAAEKRIAGAAAKLPEFGGAAPDVLIQTRHGYPVRVRVQGGGIVFSATFGILPEYCRGAYLNRDGLFETGTAYCGPRAAREPLRARVWEEACRVFDEFRARAAEKTI